VMTCWETRNAYPRVQVWSPNGKVVRDFRLDFEIGAQERLLIRVDIVRQVFYLFFIHWVGGEWKYTIEGFGLTNGSSTISVQLDKYTAVWDMAVSRDGTLSLLVLHEVLHMDPSGNLTRWSWPGGWNFNGVSYSPHHPTHLYLCGSHYTAATYTAALMQVDRSSGQITAYYETASAVPRLYFFTVVVGMDDSVYAIVLGNKSKSGLYVWRNNDSLVSVE